MSGVDLHRRVYGMATLGEICEIYPTSKDREEYLDGLQSRIDDLASGPFTADTEKHFRGLSELHACVSMLPTLANGWSDDSCPDNGGCYNKSCSDSEGFYDDWSGEESLDTVATDGTNDSNDDDSLCSSDFYYDGEDPEDDGLEPDYLSEAVITDSAEFSPTKLRPEANSWSPAAMNTTATEMEEATVTTQETVMDKDEVPAACDIGGLIPLTLNAAAAPWHPPGKGAALLTSDAPPWHPTEKADKGMAPVAVTTAAERATDTATDIAPMRLQDAGVEDAAEPAGLTGFLRKMYGRTCQTLLSARAALTAVATTAPATMAAAPAVKASTVGATEIASVTPDRYRLMASRILADARGKRRLIDRPRRWEKYLESGRIDSPRRWRNYLKNGGTCAPSHTNQEATLAVSVLGATDAAVAHEKSAVLTATRTYRWPTARSAVLTATRTHRRPTHIRSQKRPSSKGRALPPRLAVLRKLAFRACTAYSRATACDFKTLEATFHSYFLNFRKARLICHLLGLFPREVIKWGGTAIAGSYPVDFNAH